MTGKKLPLILMLIAGLVTVILTYIWNYSILRKLAVIFIVMLIFFIVGSVISYIVGRFEAEIAAKEEEQQKEQDELVIEKDSDTESSAVEEK